MRVREMMSKTYWFDESCIVAEPLRTDKEVIVVSDPSKSNTATIIGTLTKEPLMIFEFSGNDPKYYNRAGDTSQFCDEMDTFLCQYLAYANVHSMWQEEVINKDIKHMKNDAAFGFLSSQKVLTEIRARLIATSRTITRKNPTEINNMAWKGAILPDGYRGDNVTYRGKKIKGSLKYFLERFPGYRWTDDVTDVMCMYLYVCDQLAQAVEIKCTAQEACNKPHTLSLYTRDFVLQEGLRFFTYNPNYTLEDNVNYYLNRCPVKGAAQIPKELVTLNLIHKTCKGNKCFSNEDYFLVVDPKGRDVM